jgi:hypothetical protein
LKQNTCNEDGGKSQNTCIEVKSEYFYITEKLGSSKKQLFATEDNFVRAAAPGKDSNTDDARRMWKFQDGYLTLRDGRQLFCRPGGKPAGARLSGTGNNIEDASRKWKFQNGYLTLCDGR